MIRLRRAIEREVCPELESIRNEEVQRVRRALREGQALDQKLLGDRYGIARGPLARMQRYKCCYCEDRSQDERWRHVEHFRPKAKVESNNIDQIQRTWVRTERFRIATQRFVALALYVLDHHVPEHVRRRWNLSLDVLYP